MASVSFQWPLADGLHHFCGGAVIADLWVVTAAHCTVYIKPGITQVRTGTFHWDTGGTLAGVTDVIPFPGFTGDTAAGDLALVRLDQSANAPRWPIGRSLGGVGTGFKVYGWGLTCDDYLDPIACPEVPAPYLQELSVRRAHDRACELTDPTTGVQIFDRATMFCIGAAGGKLASPCFGDSGGPVLRTVHGRPYLVGVIVGDGDDLVSRNHDCSTAPNGKQGHGMMTNLTVGLYRTWIHDTLRAHDLQAAQQYDLAG